MGRVYHSNLSEKNQELCLQSMFKAVFKLKSVKAVEKFFCRFLSENEIVMIGRRILIAELLLKGYTRDEIIEQLGVGGATVAKIDRWLNEGFKGYRDKVKKVKKEKGFVDYGNHCSLSLDGLADKYPAHFWLVKMLIDKARK